MSPPPICMLASISLHRCDGIQSRFRGSKPFKPFLYLFTGGCTVALLLCASELSLVVLRKAGL